MFKHKRIAIDFDGTLFADQGDIELGYSCNTTLQVMPGASTVTKWLREQGFELLIFTCRPDYHRRYLETHLNNADIAFDYILFYTKPRVDLYIDDKGFRFENWDLTKNFIEKKLFASNELSVVSQSPNQLFEQCLRKNRLDVLIKITRSFSDITNILDFGCGDGLTDWPSTNWCVDGYDTDKNLLQLAAKTQHYRNVYAELPDLRAYDCISLMGVLEHVKHEEDVLNKLLNSKYIFITVPNALSLHRLAGVKMQLLENPYELQAHDFAVGHQKYYDPTSLDQALLKNLQNTHSKIECGTISVKTGSNAQMIPMIESSQILNSVGEDVGLTGPNTTHGAEIYSFWRRNV